MTIEAFHFVDEGGHIAWRAKGRTARGMDDLAAMLGVIVEELHPRPDPEQWEAAQKRQRRAQAARMCKGANWTPW
jgi:hypothetical protein